MKFIYLSIALLIGQLASATDFVHIFARPDTFNISAASPFAIHNIDINNDGLDDIQLSFDFFATPDTSLNGNTIGNNGWEIEEIRIQGTTDKAIAYTCGAAVNAGSGFTNAVTTFVLYKGNGPRYLSVRKLAPDNVYYYYGWAKIEVNAATTQCIIYATGYSDLPYTGTESDVIVGNGECTHVGIDEQTMEGFSMFAYNGIVNVTSPQPATIHVYDVLGKAVASYQFEGGKSTYDLHAIGTGCYFVEAVSGTQRKMVKVVL